MIKLVVVNFNLDVGPGQRSDEHPSFQYYVQSLADVPVVGDYVGMMSWSKDRGYYRRMVKVTARRIAYEPQPDERYDEDTEMTYFVTLMVEPADKDKGMPDFRG